MIAVAAAGSSILAAPSGAQGRHLVVVSDSILLGARDPLTSVLGREGWSVTFDAAVSRSTLAGAEAVRAHQGEITDSLLVSLGANDSGSTATFSQRVEAVMAAAASVPNVYWLTIRDVRPYYGPANLVLLAAAARHPNLHLVDWNAASAGRTDLTASDGLHLNGAGGLLLTSLITASLTGTAAPAAAAPIPPPTSAAPVTTAVPTTVADAPDPTPPAAPEGVSGTTAAADVVVPTTVSPAAPTERTRTVEPSSAAATPDDDGGPDAGGGPWAWVIAAVVAATVVSFAVRRRWGPAGPVLHASMSRQALRRARLVGVRQRHPSTPRNPADPVDHRAEPDGATSDAVVAPGDGELVGPERT